MTSLSPSLSPTYRAYSWGKGLEYHVSMSHLPNSIAAGQRSWAASAIDGGLRSADVEVATARLTLPPAFISSLMA